MQSSIQGDRASGFEQVHLQCRQQIPGTAVHAHRGVRPIFKHLVLPGPTIKYFDIQVAPFLEVTGCLLQRRER